MYQFLRRIDKLHYHAMVLKITLLKSPKYLYRNHEVINIFLNSLENLDFT